MDSPTSEVVAQRLGDLVRRRSRETASSPYLLDARSSRVLAYDDLLGLCDERGRQLDQWGLRPGDRVGLMFTDPLEFATWFLAGVTAGLWVAPLDPTQSTEPQRTVEDRVQVLDLDAVLHDFGGGSSGTGDVRVTTRVTANDAPSPSAVSGDGGGVILASSGSTGAPKIIALSEEQILTNAALIARHHKLTRVDRGFNPLPWWHVNAEVVGILATLSAGASLVMDDRFHRTGFWKTMSDYDVTWINAVPAIIARLAALEDDERVPSSVRFVRSASAPLSPGLARAFEAATGVTVVQSYGMTEAASQICVNPLEGLRKPGSVGVPVGTFVRVVGEDGEGPLLSGVVGRIEVKGSTVITAYESPEYDDRFDVEGWLRTGDLGYFDDDGYLFIAGREDDVINRGGEKIYPIEIEEILSEVEGVESVVILGEADDVFGQVVIAYVQPRDGAALVSETARASLLDGLRRRATRELVRARRPSAFRLVERLPTAATGKVRRVSLRGGDVAVAYEENF